MTVHYHPVPMYDSQSRTRYVATDFKTMPQTCSDFNQGAFGHQNLTVPVVPSGYPVFTYHSPSPSPLLSFAPYQSPTMSTITSPSNLTIPLFSLGTKASPSTSNSPSPVFGAMPEPYRSQSPCAFFAPVAAPNSQMVNVVPVPMSASSQRNWSPPLVQNSPPNVSECEVLYELPIIKHHANVSSLSEDYSEEIAEALRKVLGYDVWYLFVTVISHDKAMSIIWNVHPLSCPFESLLERTRAKDFNKRLICELAHIGVNGAFNKHLHGSKQLTIVNEGWNCFHRLSDALVSYNGAKERLLQVATEDEFDANNMEDLFRVSAAPSGMALRGSSVVGAHFRSGDVLKLSEYLDEVERIIGEIRVATMIPSMKGKTQYKGWSIYIETGNTENVERIKEASSKYDFEKAEIFTAVDRFQH